MLKQSTKATTIIPISILLFKCSFGQIDFVDDTALDDRFLDLNQKIDSAFKLERSNDFEFRLWTQASMTSYKNLFILSKKGSLWKARFFESSVSRKREFREIVIRNNKLDSLWQRLEANQVLTLPTQDSLKFKMKIFIADTSYALDAEDTYKQVQIMDGISYNFQLFSGRKRRVYDYHCPQSYSRNYPNVEELYRAFAIIVLVRKYVGLNLIVC